MGVTTLRERAESQSRPVYKPHSHRWSGAHAGAPRISSVRHTGTKGLPVGTSRHGCEMHRSGRGEGMLRSSREAAKELAATSCCPSAAYHCVHTEVTLPVNSWPVCHSMAEA